MAKKILRTKLCDMLGIEYPILSAGMGPTLWGEATGAPVDLVVAVSEAGGCGVLGASAFTLPELRAAIKEIRSRTSKPFGVDLLLPKHVDTDSYRDLPDKIPLSEFIKQIPKEYRDWIEKVKKDMQLPDVEVMCNVHTTTVRPQEAIQICLEEEVPLFAAGLGDPAGMVEQAHERGIKVLAITGNVKNAKRMAPGGIDMLVAQGHEGGGHTGRIGSMALLPQVIDAVSPLPVLAAGGIGDGRGLAAALALGCAGVWVGTRFLATHEGGALPANKKKILGSMDEGTRVSTAYTGKTLRASYNGYHDLWAGSGLPPLPFPTQGVVASALMAAFIEANKEDYIGGLAGQVSGLINEIKPAAEVVSEMVEEAVDIFKNRIPASVALD